MRKGKKNETTGGGWGEMVSSFVKAMHQNTHSAFREAVFGSETHHRKWPLSLFTWTTTWLFFSLKSKSKAALGRTCSRSEEEMLELLRQVMEEDLLQYFEWRTRMQWCLAAKGKILKGNVFLTEIEFQHHFHYLIAAPCMLTAFSVPLSWKMISFKLALA